MIVTLVLQLRRNVKIQNNLEVLVLPHQQVEKLELLLNYPAQDITIRNITGVAATFTGVLTYEDVTKLILLASSPQDLKF